jgi:hypothetical protein
LKPKQKFLVAVTILFVAACMVAAGPGNGFAAGNTGERTWLSQLRST